MRAKLLFLLVPVLVPVALAACDRDEGRPVVVNTPPAAQPPSTVVVPTPMPSQPAPTVVVPEQRRY